MKAIEYRNFNSASDIRAIGDKDEWTFEGYAVTWGTIDDYNSTFRKGSFRKTITERGNRIKVLWNHNIDEPIALSVAPFTPPLKLRPRYSVDASNTSHALAIMTEHIIIRIKPPYHV